MKMKSVNLQFNKTAENGIIYIVIVARRKAMIRISKRSISFWENVQSIE